MGAFRQRVGRILGPLARARHGWWFVTRRAVARSLSSLPRPVRAPEGVHAVSVERAAAMVAGARLHRPDPGFPVLELPDGLVLGPWGEIAVDPNTVITDMAMRYGKRSPTRVSTVLRDCADAAAGPVRELPGRSVTLVQRSHGNYGHWLFQGLVRFDVLERTVGFDACDRFLVSNSPPGFLVEVFERNSIDWSRAERISNVPGSYRCETLIAPGLPQRAGDSPRWALDRVRDRYGSPPTADAPRRVYLPRGPGARRQVVNEADVVACLERRGFQTVSTAGYTIAEQAAFVAAAECIVAPLGAALANMVFAPRDVHIVELIGANFFTNAYEDVAATLGMPFTRLVGVDPGLPRVLPQLHEIDAETIVDIAALEHALDAIGFR